MNDKKELEDVFKLYKNNEEDLENLFDIVEKETPFYRFRENIEGYTEKERNIIKDWFMNIIEGKEYSVDMKTMFDCFINRLLVKRNLKLLKMYKNKLYEKVKLHRNIDEEVYKYSLKSIENREKIESFTS